MNEAFYHQTVVTLYNKRNYRIDSIDFQKNPTSEFVLADG